VTHAGPPFAAHHGPRTARLERVAARTYSHDKMMGPFCHRTLRPGRFAAATLVLCLCGCDWKGGGRIDGPTTEPPQPTDHWVIRPAHMRVYPTTRFVHEGGDTILNAWIELSDETDDPTKGVGRFRFELLGPSRAGGPSPAARLYTWNVDMLTLEQNRQFYDPVTRTYLFRLKVDRPAVTERRLTLHVTFTPVDGSRLDTQTQIEPQEAPGEASGTSSQ
jgi:hypothetical protein